MSEKKEDNLNREEEPGKERGKKSAGGKISSGFKAVGGWFARMFKGGSNSLADDQKFKVEEIISPGKQIFQSFFSKKLALFALIGFVCLFLFVFIASAVKPLDLSYQESLQKNISPGFTMMSVPKKMRGQLKSVSSFSTYSVGVGLDGTIAVWGKTSLGTSKVNVGKIPDEVKNSRIEYAAAGSDHIIAVDEHGKIYGWGLNNNAQYGRDGSSVVSGLITTVQPDELIDGNIDVDGIRQLSCGYQVTSIVMKDGGVYIWGNSNTISNISKIDELTNVEKIVFTNSAAVALLKDRTFDVGGTKREPYGVFGTVMLADGTTVKTKDFLADKDVLDIAATSSTLALMVEDTVTRKRSTVVAGNILYRENEVPALSEGEYFVELEGGNKHYSGITNEGRVYSWGSGSLGQTKAPGKRTDPENTVLYACSFQNYMVDGRGRLMDKWGLSGYLMGTDDLGRDVFTRVVHGGKMTLTVGAVAVVISSFIGILVGCLSGYFGGWTDMLLMRLTEIVSSIPFLPFALILSAVLRTSPVGEMGRIVIIMVILGILSWPGLARLVRGQVLAEREKEFVTAAKAMGVKENKIAFRHILPNVISVIIVSMTLDFAGCMLTESSLSYLGFGVQLPRPTWGNMLNGANNSLVIQSYWWRWVFPSVFLAVATICINIIGDALRDVMDPKSSLER